MKKFMATAFAFTMMAALCIHDYGGGYSYGNQRRY